jgi:uncharacterized protein involved in type VI secretion and phage assembly
MKAVTHKDIENAQKSATGSEAVTVMVTSGKTRVPFLYPGCIVDMRMRKYGEKETDYFTRLMITEVNHSVDKLGNYTANFEAVGADTGYLPAPKFHTPIAQPQIAIVTKNNDEKGRIQVKFDWQRGNDTTEWIRVMTPDAGSSDQVSKNRGFVAIPEIGDQVMVGFVHNHPDRPYVMGGMFHGKIGAGGGSGNNIKSLSSKSGHIIELNDAKGITVKDKTGGNSVVIDGNNTITVTAGKNIILTDKQNITLTNGQASIVLDSDTIKIHADKIEIGKGDDKGGATTDASSLIVNAETTVLTAKTSFNVGTGNLSINSTGTGDIEAKGVMTIKGNDTDIN